METYPIIIVSAEMFPGPASTGQELQDVDVNLARFLKRQRILKVMAAKYIDAQVPMPPTLTRLLCETHHCHSLAKREFETMMREFRATLREASPGQ